MRRRQESGAIELVKAHWSVSVVLGLIVFAVMKWGGPAFATRTDNPFIKPFLSGFSNLAPYSLLIFAILALASFLFARKRRGLVDSQSGLDSLRALSWQEFEWMVGEAYRRQGYAVEESIGGGADGGIDLVLRQDGQTTVVQCKRWKTSSVGAPILREIFGLLTHHRANAAIVVTCGNFTREAIAFAEGKPVVLVDGPRLLELVRGVQRTPAPSSTATAPTSAPPPPPSPETESVASPIELPCPTCGASMVRRISRRGANSGNAFWGCSSYPRCTGTRAVEQP